MLEEPVEKLLERGIVCVGGLVEGQVRLEKCMKAFRQFRVVSVLRKIVVDGFRDVYFTCSPKSTFFG